MNEVKSGDVICSHCECPINFHCNFYPCPLYENELICVDCCHTEVQKEEALKLLEQITGKKLLPKEVEDTCKACGKRDL